MGLLMVRRWRWLWAVTITAIFVVVACHLSEQARHCVDRTFIWPIERAIRSAW